MSPLFYGISEFSPVCMAKLESKVSSRNKIVPILWPVTSTALAKAAAHPAQVCLGHWDVCMSTLSSLIANGIIWSNQHQIKHWPLTYKRPKVCATNGLQLSHRVT
jgi:hypothetical protein